MIASMTCDEYKAKKSSIHSHQIQSALRLLARPLFAQYDPSVWYQGLLRVYLTAAVHEHEGYAQRLQRCTSGAAMVVSTTSRHDLLSPGTHFAAYDCTNESCYRGPYHVAGMNSEC